MATVKEIYARLNDWAPFSTQMEFDNAGLLVGHTEQNSASVLVSLDITEEVVQEARELGAQLIVSHHPVIFHPVKRITDDDPTGRILLSLAESQIAAICAHTNLDAAQGGVNDCLAQALELQDIGLLHQDGTDGNGRAYGIGRIGMAHQSGWGAGAYAAYVKEALGAQSVRVGDAGRPVRRVAVGGGSCGSMLPDVLAAGCDTFVTADVKYDMFLQAKAMGVNLLDAGHFATEQVVCPAIQRFLLQKFPELTVQLTGVHQECYQGI